MPTLTMEGLSGVDTKPMIEKLKQFEERPIHRMKNEQDELKFEIESLKALREQTQKLEESLRVLYNFDAAFEKKVIESNPPGFIEGVANKNAEDGTHDIKINNLATVLKVKSNPIKSKEKLSPALININGTEKKFSGGSIHALKEFFNSNFNEILTAKTVNIDSENFVLILEGKETGKKGVWQVKDQDKILDSLGIYRPIEILPTNAQPEKSEDKTREERRQIYFKPENISLVKEGPSEINSDYTQLSLNQNAARRFDKSPEVIADGKLKKLKIRVKYHAKTSEDEDLGPFSIIEGPVESLNIKGILLDSYNIAREREKPHFEVQTFDYGVKVNYKSFETELISLKEKGELVDVPLKEDVKSIDFYVENAQVDFINPEWIYEVKGSEKKDSEKDKKEDNKKKPADGNENFPNLIQPAQNAVINFDGVEIEREKNEDIQDIVNGATLNLLKAGNETIKAEIKPNMAKAKEQVMEFVNSYNTLIQFTKEVTKSPEIKEEGKFKEAKKETGALITNATVRGLVNGLRSRILNPYPATKEPQIKILPVIGVSTGEIGSRWQDISEGYLMVDEAKLEETLLKYPGAVKDFFGVDSDGDLRVDNGMAYMTENFLKPYTRLTKGVISTQIQNNQDKISRLQKDIERTEEHVKKYEQKLREKFGRMEGSIKQQKATSEFIKNKFGGGK